MEDKDNLSFKDLSLEELIGHLSSDVQMEGQYGHMRFPPTSPPPSQDFGNEYLSENMDPAFLQRRNVFVQDNYQPYQRGSLPYFMGPPMGDRPEMVDARGPDYLVYGQQSPQNSQNMPNIHFFNKTNGTLTGFNDYGVEYSGAVYDLFKGMSFQTQVSVPQFPHNTETNTKAQLIENLVGNWTSDRSGTYSPFGSPVGGIRSDLVDNMGIGRGSRKTRIVAEVRPMRPSYSDVLSKSINNNSSSNNGNQQKPGQKSGHDVKYKLSDLKGKQPKFSIGRTLSGNGNILNRQLPSCVDESNFINNSNLKSSKKIDCESERKESLSKKWLSLDDLKNAAKRESYISLNEVKNKKNKSGSGSGSSSSSGGGGGKTSAGNSSGAEKKKEKWESSQLNGAKNLNAKPQGPKKQEKRPGKVPAGAREKENVFAQKFESARSKTSDDRRAPPVASQGKSDQQKSGKRNVRTSQPEKHRKTLKNKRKEQEPCLSAMIRSRADRYIGVLLMALKWLFRLVLDVLDLSTHLAIHMCGALLASTVVNATESYQKLCRSMKKVEFFQRITNSRFFPFKRPNAKKKSFDSDDESDDPGDTKVKRKIPRGLKHNISLPVTGEEAMKRLLACKGKDPYSILGVTHDCTDDDIKKYYKRQAFLVHPDKNNQPGAEEAFKILVHAFDIIGEPEHRKSYDRRMEKTQVEQAVWSELSDLLSQLHKKMEYVANTIRCTNCNKRHKRTTVDRPIYAARMCNQCKIHHAVREGDIWAETSLFGLLWHYYACMDGAVYDITEWAGCQSTNLRNLKANTHNVQYRIVLGKQHGQKQKYQHPTPTSESDFEDFLKNFYTKSDPGAGGAEGDRISARKRKSKKKK